MFCHSSSGFEKLVLTGGVADSSSFFASFSAGSGASCFGSGLGISVGATVVWVFSSVCSEVGSGVLIDSLVFATGFGSVTGAAAIFGTTTGCWIASAWVLIRLVRSFISGNGEPLTVLSGSMSGSNWTSIVSIIVVMRSSAMYFGSMLFSRSLKHSSFIVFKSCAR